jgi:glucose/arabinose dehydrogenase/PKD repeat protein/type 1 glutamine amidotransferase
MHVPRPWWARLAAASAAVLLFTLLPSVPAQAAEEAVEDTPTVLIFTKTTQFRHTEAIVEGTPVLQAAFEDAGIASVHTEDSSVFNDAELAKYDALVMFQASGDPWTAEEKAALERYQQAGGGIVAIHNATDMRGNYKWWDDMIGALMPGHAATGNSPGLPGTVRVEDQTHPSTAHLPQRWQRADEWYNYSANVRGKAHVLATMDESTYAPGGNAMGYDHPISWCRPYDGGRAWMTGMGHFGAHYKQEPNFVQHIVGGVKWAAGLAEGDCGGTDWSQFEKVALDENTSAPFAMDIAPDGRVFFTELVRGQIRVYDPKKQTTSTAVEIPVYSGGEDGLLGIALHPDFAQNKHLYVYYSPASANDSDPANFFSQVSRFTVSDGSVIDPASEKVIIKVPARRLPDEPGHTGGGLDFDKNGNLFLSVGDDVNPHSEPSGGYAPLSERPGQFHDARATSANTNDLRGKLLRIHPEPDGSYTIPEGNLFAPGTEKTLPEIYAMGFRNPFRFSIDPDTGWIGLADYSPDNGSDNPTNRGPAGIAEYNIIKEPGNFGWPLCMGNNEPFRDVDYKTSPVTVGGFFDCANPINDSDLNTGLRELPPAQPAVMWYGYQRSSVPGVINQGGGLAPMGGPFYDYDENLVSDTKFPEYYDGKPFFYEWARNRMYSLILSDAGKVEKANPFLPNERFLAPIDSKFGPDGSLYVLDWGGGFGRHNPDSGLHRIDYISGSRSPIAEASATPDSGIAPLTVTFDGTRSSDPEGASVTYAWDFDGDGTTDSTEPKPTHTYTVNGVFDARLTVTDPDGKTGTTTVPITVGNTRPVVNFNLPPNGGFFDFGDDISWNVEVTDAEDGTVPDESIIIQPALGHDEHAHPAEPLHGRTGTVTTALGGGHGEDMNVFYVIDARYEDKGGDGVPSLTGSDTTLLFPKKRQAEFFSDSAPGVTKAPSRDVERQGDAISAQNGQWTAYDPLNLRGVDALTLRVAAATDGTIELRRDAPDGELLGTAQVDATGSLASYADVTVDVTDPGETFTLYLVFPEAGERRVNFIEAVGKGASATTKPVVSITVPAAGADLEMGEMLISADATDAENTITSVEFFVDGKSIGKDTDAPYGVAWSPPGEARYQLTAVATNDKGASTTSRIRVAEVGDLFRGWTTHTNAGGTFDRPDQNTWIVNSGGNNMWQSVDEYSSVYRAGAAGQKWTATAKIVRQGNSAGSAKAGIIVRNDMTQPGTSPGYAFLAMRPSGGFEWLRDTDGNGQLDASSSANSSSYPAWVRLVRDGENYTAYWSKDGKTFTQIGQPVKLPGASSVQDVGLAVTAHSASARSEVEFTEWELTDTVPGPDPVDEPTPLPVCVKAGSDEFEGTALNTGLWTTVRQAQNLPIKVENGALKLPVTQGDIDGTNTGPISFVGQPAPQGAWEVTTKVSLEHNRQWQHVGLMLHQDDNNYVKLAFTRGQNAPPFLEFQTETNGSRTWQGNNLAVNTGSTMHLRLTSDGTSIAAYHSADGTTWTKFGSNATVKPNATIGVVAAGDTGTPNATASVDWFRFTGGGPGAQPVVPSDEFDGTALDTCRWNAAVRPDGRNVKVEGGELKITTQLGDINGTANGGPRNFLLQRMPAGDWKVETKVKATMTHRWQLAGLIAYGDDDNYVKLDMAARNTNGSAKDLYAELVSERNAQFGNGGNRSVETPESTESGWFWLRLAKTGNSYEGWVSYDGLNWTSMGQPVTNNANLDRVGLMAIGPEQVAPVTVGFDYFRVLADEPADTTPPTVSATLDPAAPNGANGWYTAPVKVTVAGQDDQPGAVTLEYRLDGGAWTAYTTPVSVGADGEHAVEYRATDAAGNVSAVGSSSFKIDAAKPAVTVLGVANGGSVGSSASAVLSFQATDAHSGVASTTATLDGKPFTSGTAVEFYELDLGEHTLVVTSTDNAGNVATETVTFRVTTSLTDVHALVQRFNQDGTVSDKTTESLLYSLTRAIQADDVGSEKRTIGYLEQFRDRVNSQVKGDERDLMVRQLLRRDAEALIEHYRVLDEEEGA